MYKPTEVPVPNYLVPYMNFLIHFSLKKNIKDCQEYSSLNPPFMAMQWIPDAVGISVALVKSQSYSTPLKIYGEG